MSPAATLELENKGLQKQGEKPPLLVESLQVPSILLTETACNAEMFIVSQSRPKKDGFVSKAIN